jgi:DNA-binding MarR family transcriptional regulator
MAMALRAAYLAMHRRTDAAVSDCGVTADQFVVLLVLSRGTALTQRELVERTSSDPNTLRAMLVLLEQRGLVVRKPHPTDGRARSVSLTRQGRRVFKQAWELSNRVREGIVQPFSERQADVLVKLLRRLATNLTSSPAGVEQDPAGTTGAGKIADESPATANRKSTVRKKS